MGHWDKEAAVDELSGSCREVSGSSHEVSGSCHEVSGSCREVTGSRHEVTGSSDMVIYCQCSDYAHCNVTKTQTDRQIKCIHNMSTDNEL